MTLRNLSSICRGSGHIFHFTRRIVTPPPLLNQPPISDQVTDYDLAHKITYLRLLDADADGADWREIARIVLDLDAGDDEKQARKIYDSHLARARWMTEAGYRDLLQQRDN